MFVFTLKYCAGFERYGDMRSRLRLYATCVPMVCEAQPKVETSRLFPQNGTGVFRRFVTRLTGETLFRQQEPQATRGSPNETCSVGGGGGVDGRTRFCCLLENHVIESQLGRRRRGGMLVFRCSRRRYAQGVSCYPLFCVDTGFGRFWESTAKQATNVHVPHLEAVQRHCARVDRSLSVAVVCFLFCNHRAAAARVST